MDFGGEGGRKNILVANLGDKTSCVELAPNYWDLVSLGFYNYVLAEKKEPHGFRHAKSALELIFAAKRLAIQKRELRPCC